MNAAELLYTPKHSDFHSSHSSYKNARVCMNYAEGLHFSVFHFSCQHSALKASQISHMVHIHYHNTCKICLYSEWDMVFWRRGDITQAFRNNLQSSIVS